MKNDTTKTANILNLIAGIAFKAYRSYGTFSAIYEVGYFYNSLLLVSQNSPRVQLTQDLHKL
jgi:hypothetical protein